MKLSLISLAVIPSLISAAVFPNVAPRNATLDKRGGEVNYLANCLRYDFVAGVGGYQASYIGWYSNVDNSLNRERPDSLSNEYRDWPAGTYLTWEGKQQNIYFSDSGVTVQTHIDSDARGRAFTSWAGWAQRTSDWKTFNCYRASSSVVL